MQSANLAIDAAHNFSFLQKVVDKPDLLRKNPPVRCGSLAAVARHRIIDTNPEFLAGLRGPAKRYFSRLPSQGPAPLSTWGFSLAERFSSDRTTCVKSGPAWAASQKHRPSATRMRAERPVSEGPQKVQGRVVKTNPVSMNRCLMGALGCRVGYRHLDGDR
jgi:hypothetical protein